MVALNTLPDNLISGTINALQTRFEEGASSDRWILIPVVVEDINGGNLFGGIDLNLLLYVLLYIVSFYKFGVFGLLFVRIIATRRMLCFDLLAMLVLVWFVG